MAGVPRFRALRFEDIDLDNTEEAFRQLIGYISVDFETLSDALAANITFRDNIASEYREYTFTTPSDYATNFTAATFPHTLRTGQAEMVLVAQIYKVGSLTSVTTTEPVSVDWYDNGSSAVVIKRISGLEASTEYSVRLLIA